MSEPKVIELTEKELNDWAMVLSNDSMDRLQHGQDVLLKAPQPKLVHLSDLPDGTIVTTIYLNVVQYYYYDSGVLYGTKSARGGYSCKVAPIQDKCAYRLIPGEFKVWRGGECPWPQYVEVEVMFAAFSATQGHVRRIEKDDATKINWGKENIIAHRCTGRLLDGAKLVP